MNIAITFRHMDATDAVKNYAQEKLSRLQKFLRQPMKVTVVVSTQHRTHTAEVDIHAGSDHFHAHESSEDMYATLDRIVDKLERQITDGKAAATSKRKGGERAADLLTDETISDE